MALSLIGPSRLEMSFTPDVTPAGRACEMRASRHQWSVAAGRRLFDRGEARTLSR
jgi:hypothetical protein